VNDRAYRDLGGGVYESDEPADPMCPTCRRLSSVTQVGALWFCTSCDLAFGPDDAARVDPKWAQKYRERREEGHAEPLPVRRFKRPAGDSKREAS
jgi:ribosomal protein L37AE/L43A